MTNKRKRENKMKFYIYYKDQNNKDQKYSFILDELDFFEADKYAQEKCKKENWTYISVGTE